MAATLAMGVAVVAPAEAHNQMATYWQYRYNDGRQCIGIAAQQNHGGAYLSRYVRTDSLTGGCGGPFAQPAGRIAHRGWAYKSPGPGQPGTLCLAGGWQYTSAHTSYLEYKTFEDLWPWCNYGWGRGVLITHDVESAVWNPWTQSAIYRQALPHPTTRHCHDLPC